MKPRVVFFEYRVCVSEPAFVEFLLVFYCLLSQLPHHYTEVTAHNSQSAFVLILRSWHTALNPFRAKISQHFQPLHRKPASINSNWTIAPRAARGILNAMVLTQSKAFNQLQRIQVETGCDSEGQRVTIHVESHDERLGWYTAGSLALPLCQLPLLEQALEEMRRCNQPDEGAKIIPFPTGEAAIRNCVG